MEQNTEKKTLLNEDVKKKLESIIISAVIFVVGVLFCVLPLKIIDITETILLVGVLIYGGICMLIYCLTPADFRNNSYLIRAMLALFLGILLMFVRSFFILAIGLVIIVSGARTIYASKIYKSVGDNKWWTELLVGLMFIVLGVTIAIICNTSVARKLVMIVVGVSLVLQGAANFAFMFWVRKEPKKVEKKPAENTEEAIENFEDYEVK